MKSFVGLSLMLRRCVAIVFIYPVDQEISLIGKEDVGY